MQLFLLNNGVFLGYSRISLWIKSETGFMKKFSVVREGILEEKIMGFEGFIRGLQETDGVLWK